MDSFVTIAAPLAIALIGLVAMWVIFRLISERKDDIKNPNEDEPDKKTGEA